MNSMTGYGRGDCAREGIKMTVEISSVNRKQADITVLLPRSLDVLEARVRDEINHRIARGKLTVRILLHAAEGKAARVRLDRKLAQAYVKEMKRLARELKLADTVTLDTLLRAPGVLQPVEDVDDPETYWPALEVALKKALATLLRMRQREGAHLGRDLRKRMANVRESVARIRVQAPEVSARYRTVLHERIESAGLKLTPEDEDRLTREIVFFADRSDVTEELTRLESHFKQFDDCLKSSEPVGRTLDFLSQEMNREINTIGSKANDAVISREVIVVKAEIERFREQVQNVE
jgi:uncharacterized protein (TIGR00255 family)